MSERELTTRDLAGSTPDTASTDEATAADATDVDRELRAEDEPLSHERAQRDSLQRPTASDADDSINEGREANAAAGADSAQLTGSSVSDEAPLLPTDQTDRFTARWQEIQAGFVDQPRASVEHADALVADLMQRLAASFSNERERLEQQWDRGDDVTTEDLRVTLTRYRSFFDRLLSA
jgi:hypothetical protein